MKQLQKIYRDYELSWCDEQGRPQICLLEIQTDICLDTFLLKKISKKFHFEKFKTYQDFIDAYKNLFYQKFEDVEAVFVFDQGQASSNCQQLKEWDFSCPLRYLCPKTSQPYIGVFSYKIFEDENKVQDISFLPKYFCQFFSHEPSIKIDQEDLGELVLEYLEKKLQNQKIVISFNFARRGGISLQLLGRISFKKEKITPYIFRHVIE